MNNSVVNLTAVCNITTGKLDANAAEENGRYPYFTCAPEPLSINTYAFDDDVILLAGNNASGNFHCQRYCGKFNAYQRTYVITAKQGFDIDYLYYNLKLNLQLFKTVAQGSETKFLTMHILDGFQVPNIPFETQRKIGKALSLLDSKVNCNNKIIFELESMAKTIYDYWFQQFEFPNEEGKPYKSSGGKMVWSKELKQEIPEGWSVSNLSSFINIIRGVTYSPEDIVNAPADGYVPLVKSNNLQNGKLQLEDIVYVDREKVNENQYLCKGSVFITMSSGSIEHVGKTAAIYYDMPYCYGAFCSKIEIKEEYRCLLSMFFISEYFKKKIRSIIVGTSIKNIGNSHITDNVIAIPPLSVLRRFENTISIVFDMEGEILKENQQLIALRDFLLPLLMNGQVSFKDE